MPRKKRDRSEEEQRDSAPIVIHGGPGDMEKMMAEVSRLLGEREFNSIEEAQSFLNETLASGRLDSIGEPETPLEKAQDLMYEAWQESSSTKRVKLAKQALKISPDCADAYVLLAEETARDPEEALKLYEQGVQAGERALGPDAFEELVGGFWGMIETRPYMRARRGLADALWELDRRDEAIEHYQELLRLNPGDNQGNRYVLANCLLDQDRDEELGELLDEYPEDESAAWLYTRALWWWRANHKPGISDVIQAALEQNPYVPVFMLGAEKVPKVLPDYVGWGDPSEAAWYASESLHLWLRTPMAIEWLRENGRHHHQRNAGSGTRREGPDLKLLK